MRLLHSKLFYILLLLIIGITIVLLNRKNTADISINFFVSGNNKNLGCLSVYVEDSEEGHEYSFDNGKNWQKSHYGAVYQNGELPILVRNEKKEIVNQKVINVSSIVNEAPVIELKFDDPINNKSKKELLYGVVAYHNNDNILSNVIIHVLEEKDNSILVSYLAENDGKKCYILREVENKNIQEENLEWVWPTKKPYQITRGVSDSHKGLDIYGPGRGTPVYAALDGQVVDISVNSSSGYYVILKHENGYYTRYAHMQNTSGNDNLKGASSATKYISVGQIVKAGDVIGEVGASGNSTAIHLHFEVWEGEVFKGKVLNPLSFYK